jgi:uncharacterized membrane protein
MPDALFVLTFIAALGSALVAGVLFGFSTFIMPGFGRLSAAEATRAMQSINITAITPLFMGALFGTAAVCVAAVVGVVVDWDSSYGVYVLVGGALYLFGVIGVTMVANVPRNNVLAAVDAAGPDAERVWTTYLREWTAWNHVRTIAPLIAAGLFTAALAS